MDADDSLEIRLGTFFVVLGGGSFLLFVMSDFADQVDFDYFFVALVLLGIGFYLRRSKAPPPPSTRFTWFKGFMQKMKERRAAGGKGKDKKG